MSPDDGRVLYAEHENTCVLRFEGPIRYTMAPSVDAFLNDLLASRAPRLICADLSEIESIDSTGIGLLAKIAIAQRRAGSGRPLLFSPKPDINELLCSVCLDDVFQMVDEVPDADTMATLTLTEPNERELRRTILEAHRLLSESEREQSGDVQGCRRWPGGGWARRRDSGAAEGAGLKLPDSPLVSMANESTHQPPGNAMAVSAEMARLRAELETSRALAERFRRLVESAPDAIVVVDEDARIVLVNAQVGKLFGYQPDELVGRPVEILVPDAVRPQHVRHRDVFINHPSVRPMGTGLDLSGRRKDGTEVPVEISLSPLQTPEGVLISAAIRDISERRLAQDALRRAHAELEQRVRERTAALEDANRALQAEMADRDQAEKALHQAQKMEAVGQLTGGIAHDFNNLLTVVMGNLQILASQLRGDAQASELIAAALSAAKRGADLNRTLLMFSRKQRLAPVPVDFNDMITRMAGMLRRTFGETIRIGIVTGANVPFAMADPTQLETALLNLAVNARDAMPDGGTLTIETAAVTFDAHYAALEGGVAPGKYAMLAVSDTGTGMSAAVAARAFEPFFTTKEIGKGSGLGLAMVYGFAKQSGGHAKIYSEIGLGTTVKLFLPIIESPAPSPLR